MIDFAFWSVVVFVVAHGLSLLREEWRAYQNEVRMEKL